MNRVKIGDTTVVVSDLVLRFLETVLSWDEVSAIHKGGFTGMPNCEPRVSAKDGHTAGEVHLTVCAQGIKYTFYVDTSDPNRTKSAARSYKFGS